jgi:hypothetical protein
LSNTRAARYCSFDMGYKRSISHMEIIFQNTLSMAINFQNPQLGFNRRRAFVGRKTRPHIYKQKSRAQSANRTEFSAGCIFLSALSWGGGGGSFLRGADFLVAMATAVSLCCLAGCARASEIPPVIVSPFSRRCIRVRVRELLQREEI